jgi:ABC-type molybdate transport system substrate-binding protein
LALFKKQFVIILLTILGVSLAVGIWFLMKIELPEINRGKVFVIYAGSLVKTFESTLGPIFKKETGTVTLVKVRAQDKSQI